MNLWSSRHISILRQLPYLELDHAGDEREIPTDIRRDLYAAGVLVRSGPGRFAVSPDGTNLVFEILDLLEDDHGCERPGIRESDLTAFADGDRPRVLRPFVPLPVSLS